MKQEKQKTKALPLSNKCQEIILGSLLGDGSLKIHKHYRSARFSFKYSIKQKEYFFWKAGRMEEISSERCWWFQEEQGTWGKSKKLRYQSRALSGLTTIYHLISENGSFTIQRKWLDMLTPLSLAMWWLDDGSLIGSGRQGVFCTDGFSYEQQVLLSSYLDKAWGIKTAIGEKKKGLNQYRLWVYSSENMKKFLRIILPHIQVESMLYKVILLYKDFLLQQRWISEVAELSDFSEEIIRKHLEIKKRKWKNFRE